MRFLLILLLFTIVAPAFSQSFYYEKYDRRWIASAGTGTTSYFGELSNSGQFFDTRPNLNIGIERKLTTRLSARSELTWYSIDGSDAEATEAGRRNRNLSFFAHNFEWNIEMMVGIFREGRRYYQRRLVNPYLFAGVGLSWFNPKANYEGETYALRPLNTENANYSRVTPVVPAGIGVKVKLKHNWNINVEAGYRLTFTDYLDDVSSTYIDTSEIEDPVRVALIDRRPEIGLNPAEPGTSRGNPEANDGYLILNIKVEYYLPIYGKYQDFNSRPTKKKYKKIRE